MYYFIDLNEEPVNQNLTLQTVINNTNLDDQYYGQFKTLTVTGRGLITPALSYTERVGTDGAWFNSSNYPARIITVEAIINTDREFYELFNAEFGKKEIRLEFTDDPYWVWHAYLSGINEPKEDNKKLIIELEFTCLDPYKYKTAGTEIGIGTVAGILYETHPEIGIVKINETSEQIKITNSATGKNIVVRDSFISGDEITLDFLDGRIYKKRGATKEDITIKLDIFSDFETFSLKSGDEILIAPASSELVLTYTERSL